ncbi:MAG: cadherin domain-containing protein [Planctomycetales bacterium]|nr:cadherin domain-containing protein [Planctomycetales bacterium]
MASLMEIVSAWFRQGWRRRIAERHRRQEREGRNPTPRLRTVRLEERRVLSVPTITSPNTASVNENTAAVLTLTATDSDKPKQDITFSITANGADFAQFTIVNDNELQFTAAPDAENPLDANADNVYIVEIQALDSGGESSTQTITVTVLPVNETAPVFTSLPTATIAENSATAHTLTVTDADAPGDTITYTLATGGDNDLFEIVNGNELQFRVSPDFETPQDADTDNIYLVSVTANDGVHDVTQPIAITVTDVNDSPVFTSGTSVSVQENSVGTVQTLAATDQDLPAQSLTFSLTANLDSALFQLVNGNELQFIAPPDRDLPGDADADSVYDVEVQVSDGTATTTQVVHVTVTGLNDNTPVFTSATTASVVENTQAVQTLAATDADLPSATLTFSLTASGDNALFEIVSGNQLQFRTAPDFESPGDADTNNVYVVEVQVSDGLLTAAQTVLVTVTGVNDNSPVFTSPTIASVAENTLAVQTLSATDADLPADTLTYSLTASGDSSLFEIVAGNQLQFKVAPNFESPSDANTDNVYSVEVQVSDGATTVTQTIQVTVTGVNDNSPVFTSGTTASVAENVATVMTLVATDADLPAQTISYSVATTGDSALFEVVNGNELKFKVAPDFESPADADTNNVYVVDVIASDGSLTTTVTIQVTVTGANDNSPVFTSSTTATVAENTASVVALTATDADLPAQGITFSLGASGDSALFEIVNGNELQFRSAPDFESPGDANTDNIYAVEVIASDGSLSTTQMMQVTVTGVNDNSPAITSSLTPSVVENTTAVLTLTASDADLPAQTVGFSLTGSNDSALFEIVNGNELRFRTAPDFEAPGDGDANNVYLVEVIASDGSLSTTQTLQVTVTGANEFAPVFTSPATATIVENNASVLTLTATDADLPAQSLTFSLGAGGDNALFEIVNGNELRFRAAPDFESPADANADNVYELTLIVSDGALSNTQTVQVTVTADNDNAPVFTSTSTPTVAENTTPVVLLTATDADLPAQSVTFSLGGSGDSSLFHIVNGNELRFLTAPDFEAPGDGDLNNVYDVEVIASDGALSTTQIVHVNVSPVNDNLPSFTSSVAVNVAENVQAVQTLTAADADLPGDTLTYTLTAAGDSALFEIVGGNQLQFRTAPDFESPVDGDANNVYSVEVQVSDGTFSATQTVQVTVTAVNDNSPVFTSANTASVAENTAFVQLLSATDADLPAETLTFSLTAAGDSALFEIVGGNQLQFRSAPDFDNPGDANSDNIYLVEVVSSDGLRTTTQTVSVTVTNANDETPAITSSTSVNVQENTASVLTLTASDADLPPQVLTFSLGAGGDSALFEIVGGNQLQFRAAPDFEAPTDANLDNIYEVEVIVSDGLLSSSVTVSVTVTAVNDNTPVFTSSSTPTVLENQTAVITVVATDADLPAQSISYRITGGADRNDFRLNGPNGDQLVFFSAPDFESPNDANGDNVYEVTIEASDGNGGGSLSVTQTLLVTVLPVNEFSPVFSSSATPSVAENNLLAQVLVATDADASGPGVTYSISVGGDSSQFRLVGDRLEFVTAPDFEAPTDADHDNVYEVDVIANDGQGNSTVQSMQITVTAVNDNAPIFGTPALVTVFENNPIATVLTVTDADAPAQTITLSINGGADQALFQLNGNQLEFVTTPDFDAPHDANLDNLYEVEILASDGQGLSTVLVLTVQVLGVNDHAPVFVSPQQQTVLENNAFVHTLVATDADLPAQAITFTIAGGADSGSFRIVAGNQLEFVTPPDFDAPTDAGGDNFYDVEILADDGNGLTTLQTVRVEVQDVNDLAPAIPAGQQFAVDENAANGTVVGRVSVVDDAAGAYTFSLVSGNANLTLGQNSAFSINANGDVIVNNSAALDFETSAQFVLGVTVADGALISPAQTIQVNLTDLVEAITYNTVGAVVAITEETGTLHLRDGVGADLIAPHVLANVSQVTINGVNTSVSVQGAAIPIGGVNVNGGGALDTLIGPQGAVNTWTLTSSNNGDIDGNIRFTGIERLQGSGADQLTVQVGPLNTIRHGAVSGDSGNFDFDFDHVNNVGVVDLTYKGMSDVTLQPASVQHLVLDLSAGNDQVQLTPTTLTSLNGTSAQLTFAEPVVSLIVRGGNGDDAIALTSPGMMVLNSNVRIEDTLGVDGLDVTFQGPGNFAITGDLQLVADDVQFLSSVTAGLIDVKAGTIVDQTGGPGLLTSPTIRLAATENIGEATNLLDVLSPAVQAVTTGLDPNGAGIYLQLHTNGGAITPVFNGSTINSDIHVVSGGDWTAGTISTAGDNYIALVGVALDIAGSVSTLGDLSLAGEITVSSASPTALQADELAVVSLGSIGGVNPLPTAINEFAALTRSPVVRVANQGVFELGSMDVLVDNAGTFLTVTGISANLGTTQLITVTPQVTTSPPSGVAMPVTGGEALITIALADPRATGHFVGVFWPTNGRPVAEVYTGLPTTTPTGTLRANSAAVRFPATFVNNPDPNDPLAPVLVPFEVRSPAGIELLDATDPNNQVLLSNLSGKLVFQILSFGVPAQRTTGAIVVTEQEVATPLPDPLPVTPPQLSAPTPPLAFMSAINNQSLEVVRKFVLRIVVSEEDSSRELDLLEFRSQVPLKELFADLPNNHYRLYLIEGDVELLIKDFILENGKERDQDVAGETEDVVTQVPEGADQSLPAVERGRSNGDVNASATSEVADELMQLDPAAGAALAGVGMAIEEALGRDERRLGLLARLLRRADSLQRAAGSKGGD